MKLSQLIHDLKVTCLPAITFTTLKRRDDFILYAGDVPNDNHYNNCIGLSLLRSDYRHIKHDLNQSMPLADNSINFFQSEDVFEHIEPERLPFIINDIYRILKPAGVFRLSMPDYQCDIHVNRSVKDEHGRIVFDPEGEGNFVDNKVINHGHVWFPTYMSVKALLEKTNFSDLVFYHYYDADGVAITKPIDYSNGYVKRTPDHDKRVQNPYRPLSIVVDCIKN